jgi:hypothetical protein
MVEKASTETKIVKASYVKNPFLYWMDNLATDNKQLMASIPFVRNLIEYTKGIADPDYLKLTSLLHFKNNTTTVTLGDLADIYNGVFPNLNLALSNPTKKVFDLIIEIVDGCLSATESINLENKIVLSMAIRLKAEKFILSKLTDKSEPTSHQTRILFDRYKNEFVARTGEPEKISILEQVNLMTPENIHLNSFMYEPILDMSDEHLKSLYQNVSALN